MTLIEASDHQQVRVMGGTGALPQQCIVEFIGFPNRDGSLNESSRMQYSDNFNLENYEELIKLTQRPDLKPLFG